MSSSFGEPFEVDGIMYYPDLAGHAQHQGFGQVKEDTCQKNGIQDHYFCLKGTDAAVYSATIGKYVTN